MNPETARFALPVFTPTLLTASQNAQHVVDFAFKVQAVRAMIRDILAAEDEMRREVSLRLNDDNLENILQVMSICKADLFQYQQDLGEDPFLTPPTNEQSALIRYRDDNLGWIFEHGTTLRQAIFQTLIHSDLRARIQSQKQSLGRALDVLEEMVDRHQSIMFSGRAGVHDAGALDRQLNDLVRIIEADMVRGIRTAVTTPSVRRLELAYAGLIQLCQMRSLEEFEGLMAHARQVQLDDDPLVAMEEEVDSVFNDVAALHAKLTRGREILAEVELLKNEFLDLEIQVTEAQLAKAKARRQAARTAELDETMAMLEHQKRSLLFVKNRLDNEMRHLVSKPEQRETVACYFPELFHQVTMIWEPEQAGQIASEVGKIAHLLLKADLLLPQTLGQFGEPNERMRLTMAEMAKAGVRGAVAHVDGSQVVLKRIAVSHSLEEIRKMQRVLRASKLAAHASILACVGGIVVSDREICLVFPYMKGGDLDFWSKEHVRPAHRKIDVLVQVADAVAVLHQINIFHRDIKPWNVVMESSLDNAVPKLTDFDMSKELGAAQAYNTTWGLNGTTREFRAPEAGANSSFSAENYGKQDVYSFGATAERLMGDDDAHAALFAQCMHDDPDQRPTAKEVYQALSKRTCVVCLEDDVVFKDCVVCPDGLHCICKGCFDDWVTNQLTAELGQRKDFIDCPSCDTHTPFPILLYVHLIDLVLKAHREQVEVVVARRMEADMEGRLERERGLGVVALSLRKVEDLLISRCPQCKTAFLDFSGCCALTCAGCNIQFCAFCHQGASQNAHAHVRDCEENPARGGFFCDAEPYNAQQKRFKSAKVRAFLETLDLTTRQQVSENPVVREYL